MGSGRLCTDVRSESPPLDSSGGEDDNGWFAKASSARTPSTGDLGELDLLRSFSCQDSAPSPRGVYARAEMRSLLLFVMLVSAWLLWSGGYSWPGAANYNGITASLGVFSIVGVFLITRRLVRVAGAGHAVPFGIGHLLYLPWLIMEIIKSNLDVARIVLSQEMKISPRLIRVKASQETVLGQVVYANSITLTPGTVSLDLRDGEILVHALTNETAEGVLTGEMDARVCRLEKMG